MILDPCHRSGLRPTPGALAPIRVVVSRFITTYSTPSEPLASTFRFPVYAVIRNASAVRERLGRPPVGPSFRCQSFWTCRLLRLRRNQWLHLSSSFATDTAFTQFQRARLSRRSHKSVSRGVGISELHNSSLALQPADLFVLLTDQTQLALCP